MMKLLCYAAMFATIARVGAAQTPDTSHAIRVPTVLVGPAINNRIAVEMTRQNIAVTSESPHQVTGSPIDAADITIRANIAEEGEGNVVVLSAVGMSGNFANGPALFSVDRGTHRGKEWQRLEDLAAGLRKTLVVR